MGDNKKNVNKNDVKKAGPRVDNDQLGENAGTQYEKTAPGATCKNK